MAMFIKWSPFATDKGLIDQLVRSPALQAGGREFESRSVHLNSPTSHSESMLPNPAVLKTSAVMPSAFMMRRAAPLADILSLSTALRPALET